ncbi:MAG: GTP 3',8-cyclase MoaA, partial [Nitrospirae bacterium]
ILSFDDILIIARAAVKVGIDKIRITGGEPLTRPDIVGLISEIDKIKGIKDLSLTTNGVLLNELALPLFRAGLNRINVSLDSLKAERYREITGGGRLSEVLKGIKEAKRVGFNPIKINNVPVRGLNDDEIEIFAKLTMNTDISVRFIELMPIGSKELWKSGRGVPMSEVKKRVESIAPLIPQKIKGYGPARYFKYRGGSGTIGFISAVTEHFCHECNRLRITCDGRLRPCLFSDREIDLKKALRSDRPEEEIEGLFRLAITRKPKEHNLRHSNTLRPMSEIGG